MWVRPARNIKRCRRWSLFPTEKDSWVVMGHKREFIGDGGRMKTRENDWEEVTFRLKLEGQEKFVTQLSRRTNKSSNYIVLYSEKESMKAQSNEGDDGELHFEKPHESLKLFKYAGHGLRNKPSSHYSWNSTRQWQSYKIEVQLELYLNILPKSSNWGEILCISVWSTLVPY